MKLIYENSQFFIGLRRIDPGPLFIAGNFYCLLNLDGLASIGEIHADHGITLCVKLAQERLDEYSLGRTLVSYEDRRGLVQEKLREDIVVFDCVCCWDQYL